MTSTSLALAIRILIALCTRTFFQPDEYFQSLEPAHNLIFGYGHLTWEWQTAHPIRSILYPLLNAPIYWSLKASGLSEQGRIGSWLLIAGPRILHGAFAAATDVWCAKLTRSLLGERYVSTAFFLSLTSFFHALSLSRSLSNSLETSLTTIAFSYYPWDASDRVSSQLIFNKYRMRKMLSFVALACAVRPANAVIWVYMFANLFWRLRHHSRLWTRLLLNAIIAMSFAVLSIFIIDSLYYKKPTFTPINFLLTNLSAVSLFYGANAPHYYLTQAFPILCTTSLPFVLHGALCVVFDRKALPLRAMLGVIAWTTVIYSMAGHKEWRFLHPLLPLLHILATKSLVDLSDTPSTVMQPKPKTKTKAKPSKSKPGPRQTPLSHFLPPIRITYLSVILLNIPASIFVIAFYNSSPISVMSYIRNLPREELTNGALGFLMPCHSTPGHAYLHRRELAQGGMWALGCEPPLGAQNLTGYKDQTDIFFESPTEYFRRCFPSKVDPSFPSSPFPTSIPGAPVSQPLGLVPEYPWVHEWPRYLVLFGALLKEDGVREILEEKGYREVWRKGREWEGEGKRKGGVRVWRWSR